MRDLGMWAALFLLGCYHGINPAMGWLFAVALGLQEKRTSAVVASIVPIAIGHVVSVALLVALAVLAVVAFPHRTVHFAAAALLLGFGAFRLLRARHPRWVGMRVGFAGLTAWSFLMSSAHGAGLMLLPFVTSSNLTRDAIMSMPMPESHGVARGLSAAVAMIAVHTLGYLLFLTLVALAVYRWFGLSLLRTAWFNIDLVWAVVLIVTGLIVLFT